MPALTILDIDESLEARLRVRAEANGHAPEEEARLILQAALPSEPDVAASPQNLADAIHALFAPLGGVDDIDFEWMRKLPNTREPPSFD